METKEDRTDFERRLRDTLDRAFDTGVEEKKLKPYFALVVQPVRFTLPGEKEAYIEMKPLTWEERLELQSRAAAVEMSDWPKEIAARLPKTITGFRLKNEKGVWITEKEMPIKEMLDNASPDLAAFIEMLFLRLNGLHPEAVRLMRALGDLVSKSLRGTEAESTASPRRRSRTKRADQTDKGVA